MGKSVLYLIVLGFTLFIRDTSAEHECLKLTYCNLIEADLRNVKTTANKKYSAASDSIAQFNKYLRAKEAKFTKLCQDRLKTCLKNTNTLASKMFNFPKKYQLSCDYETYSRAIFSCKNIQNWPASVTNVLPTRSQQCKSNCIINEPKPVKLSNGKFLLDYKFPIPESSLLEWKPALARLDGRAIGSQREIKKYTNAVDNGNENGWEVLDTCQDDTWVHSVHDYFTDGIKRAIGHVYLGCAKDDKEKNKIEFIVSDHQSTTAASTGSDDHLVKGECDAGEKGQFVVGLQLFFNTRYLSRVDFLCAGEKNWRETRFHYNTTDKPIILACESGTAVCSIQAKLKAGTIKYVDDLRIGCCAGNPKNPGAFENALPTSTNQTPPFCPAVKPKIPQCSCDGCQCCKIVDSVENVSNPGVNFEFTPPVSRSTEILILATISQQLSPSSNTRLDWEKQLNLFYQALEIETITISEKNSLDSKTESNINVEKIWKKYTASCNNIQVTFYEGPLLKPRRDCIFFGNCTSPPTPICSNVTDEWVLVAQHKSFTRFPRSAATDDSQKMFINPSIPLDHPDVTFMIHEFSKKLAPSPATGFEWNKYFQNMHKGVLPEPYIVKLGDVPPGQYMNIYQVMGTCGNYSVLVPSFKKILHSRSTNEPKGDKFTVAEDGSGDFDTIQAAVNATRSRSTSPITIFIKSGIYFEKVVIPSNRANLTLIGEDVFRTIISNNDYSGQKDPRCTNCTIRTSTSYTVDVKGPDFTAINLTIENTAGRIAQAVALQIEGDRAIIRNCRLLGNQDTLYPHQEGSRQYYVDSYIEGTTDFIFGRAIALFDNCTIKSLMDSYITAAATPQNQTFGFVFRNCKLIASLEATKVYLGRPWGPYAKTVFLNTQMGPHILPQGWSNWDKTHNDETAYYAEWKPLGVNVGGRAPWSKQLSDQEASEYTVKNIFSSPEGGWDPTK